METKNKKVETSEVGANPLPQPANQYVESGWKNYSSQNYTQAESDFRQALDIVPDDPDTLFALGMAQQAGGRKPESIQTFEKVIQIIQDPQYDHPVRSLMLVRLARGHINRMKTGDWGMNL